MSEYQYYEFLALDRPLTRAEMAALRQVSTRARISPTHFANHYEWGDLKADPLALLRRYFDVFVYVANWGTHQVAIRLPKSALELATASAYLPGGYARIQVAGDVALVEMSHHIEDGPPLDEYDDGTGWMPSLAPLRGELLAGDLRPLYLAWLCCAQEAEIPADTLEPPVPPGLQDLTAAQVSLAEFLRLSPHLLSAAAEASGAGKPPTEGLDAWIAAQPEPQKDRWLQELAAGRASHVRATLLRGFHDTQREQAFGSMQRRTVRELRADEAARRSVRRREQARERVAERRRKREETARAREAHLTALANRQEAAWEEIEQRATTRQPNNYDNAVALLADLREVARRAGTETAFAERVAAFAMRHRAKYSLIKRLQHAGLGGS